MKNERQQGRRTTPGPGTGSPLEVWADRSAKAVHPKVAERVRELARSGASDEQIGDALGVSASTAQRLRLALGEAKAKAGAAVVSDRRYRELAAEGLTAAEIAARTGHTIGSVRTRLSRLGLRAARLPPEPAPAEAGPQKAPAARASKVSDEDFRALHAQGLTAAEIAARTGLKVVSVTVRASRLGLSLKGRRGRPPAEATKANPTLEVRLVLPRADVGRWREAAKAEGVSLEAWLCGRLG